MTRKLTAQDLKNLIGESSTFHENRVSNKTLMSTPVAADGTVSNDYELIALILKMPPHEKEKLLRAAREWAAKSG